MHELSFWAYRITAPGAFVSNPQTVTLNHLSPGDVLVRVLYAGVNYKDALAVTGRGKVVRRFPCNAGIDLAGEVVSSVDPRFVPGQQVLCTGYDLGVSHDGGFAQYARVPAHWLVAIPPGLTPLSVMALGTAGLTAALALYRLEQHGLQPSLGPVLVTGASGAVGSLALILLKRRGYDIIAMSAKRGQWPAIEGRGAHTVIEPPDQAPKPLATPRWSAAIDNVGGATLPWVLAHTQPQGAVAVVGNAGGATFNGSVYPFILRGVSLLGIDSAYCAYDERAAIWRSLPQQVTNEELEQLTSVIAFADLPAACEAMLQGRSVGRTVLDVNA